VLSLTFSVAGGPVSKELWVEMIIKGLESEKDISQFWFTCKGFLKMAKGKMMVLHRAQRKPRNMWYNFGGLKFLQISY
jgi:hypothetical protein